MIPLYTIGYEGSDPDRLVAALRRSGVAVLADVRAVANSRKRGFSKGALRERLLAESHVLSVHLLLNDGTRGFLSRERIAAMRDGAILVNTARGAVVDENAMMDALGSGKLAHAGLDVFAVEPLPPNHPLTKLPNVTLSAHSAFRTPEASDNLIEAALEHCRRIQRENRK